MVKTLILRFGAVLAALLFSLPAAFSGGAALAEEGVWSKSARAIPRGRDFRVPSPDRNRAVLVRETALIVMDGGAPVPGIEGYMLFLPAEVSWAPDSKAFVITANEGGSDEAWFVTVYLQEYNRMNYYDVTAEAADRFKELAKCPEAGEPHFGAVRWTRESKNLLVVAELPARAACAGADAVRGYIVEVPSGKVLSELPPKKLSEDWGEFLGPRVTRRLPR